MTKLIARAAVAASVTAGIALFAGTPVSLAASASPSASCSPDQSRLCADEGVGITLTVATSGDKITAHTAFHSFDPGSTVNDGLASVFIPLAPVVADANGVASATFNVPAALPPGDHHVVFTGPLNGITHTVEVAFKVVPPSVAGTGLGHGGLPKTGTSNVIPLTEAGIGLVVLGSGVLVLVRRRRSASPLAA